MLRDDLKLAMSGVAYNKQAALLDHFASSSAIFSATKEQLTAEGLLTPYMANKIVFWDKDDEVNHELDFIEKYKIRAISYTSDEYPPNLTTAFDPPSLLFVKGDIDFTQSPEKWIAFVGTRKSSAYGEQMTKRIIREIAQNHPDAVIVSGLALGVDGVAHRTALECGLKTVAVVAHGLNVIYPPEHRDLAKDIIANGGAIVTEFSSVSLMSKYSFVQRNRIVAAISASTVMIESPLKGGSLITADLADGYGREVFSLPGRVTDKSFEGNMMLIKNSKANIVTSASDIEYVMGWVKPSEVVASQKELPFTSFILNDDESAILALFPDSDEVTVEHFYENSEFEMAKIVALLSKLEFLNLIRRVKGRMYVKV